MFYSNSDIWYMGTDFLSHKIMIGGNSYLLVVLVNGNIRIENFFGDRCQLGAFYGLFTLSHTESLHIGISGARSGKYAGHDCVRLNF